MSVNDRIVTSIDDLHRFLARLPIEATLDLSIIREGQQKQILLKQ